MHDRFALDTKERDQRCAVRAQIRAQLCARLCGSALFGCSNSSAPFDLSQATYVGNSSCTACHAAESKKWQGSHHDLAMQVATESTVLADFNDATIVHHGITSRMYRDGDRFMVHTEGPDGEMGDFEVKYVFGVSPLQQYMVEFPDRELTESRAATTDTVTQVSDVAKMPQLPRIQVLRISWDTERKAWFHLDPPDVKEKLDPHDDLHWTGSAQRWNNMCAECHSTNYQKNFTLASSANSATSASVPTSNSTPDALEPQGIYRSTFSEINVSCEACHGPGSVHVELAKQWAPGWNRQRGYGLANLKQSAENQIQSCAPCHSRRSVVAPDFQAGDDYYDYYTNQLLTEGVYYPDGQILDEDYVHGSFIQSKMYHKGIRCSDCHDPHTAKLKHSGNAVCTSCHQHPAAKYDSVSHHFHKPDSPGAQCINCHMPTTTYMDVHARHDHSLRIPRPDLSLINETPNACTACHLKLENVSAEKHDSLKLYQHWMLAARQGDAEVQAELDRANRYCDEACEKWYGESRRREEHFGTAIAAGQKRSPDADSLLRKVLSRKGYEAPAIARATALEVLSQVSPESAAEMAIKLAQDDHPLVRAAAMRAVVSADSNTAANVLENALEDDSRSVRIEAASNLLAISQQSRSASASASLANALRELEQSILFNNDRGGAHLALGSLAEQQERSQQAIEHYKNAIAVDPRMAGPRTNLAALLDRNLNANPNMPGEISKSLRDEIHRLRQEELPLLKRDVELLPSSAAIQFTYGLALTADGQRELAAVHLSKAAELEPDSAQLAQAAAMAFEATGQWDKAIEWAERTVRLSNNAPENIMLLKRIQQGANK